jgi:heterotetrameric sarcosine oxidase delta subunit
MPGLDPGIHSVAVEDWCCRYGMDCRIKSGNDDKGGWIVSQGHPMFLIRCPWCGERDVSDFAYGGEAHIARPKNSEKMSDEEWAGYVFLRSNPKGIFAERWNHAAGCRRWFNALRNTATDEILAVYKIGESRPEVASTAPATPSGEAFGSGNDAVKIERSS